MVGNTSYLFNGTTYQDMFIYAGNQTNGWIFEGMLMVTFIVFLIMLINKNYDKQEAFLASSTSTLMLAVIFIVGGNMMDFNVIGETSFLIVAGIFIGSVVNYLYNKSENE